ncbi:MAG: branched-chain amino acid ABC transporter permease [Deferrisomatales bacterium]|nr:branched-chain amino acid ABC transporter permease [Deferrisomatales bacterium]HSH69635.1 branched-chain amino acid ABC transporter permease [Deferrisomatales bacterium]
MSSASLDKKALGLTALAALVFLLAPTVLPRFYVYLLALIFVTGLLATSLNLVLGFGGMYQFHHGVFYGFGAYTAALIVTKAGLSFWLGFALAPFASALLGLVMGVICVRLSKLYFGMLQISLGSLVWMLSYRWYSLTGGDDGIHGVALPDLIASSRGGYYFTFGVAFLCLLLMYRIVQSPFGRAFQAIRDNPQRCEALGIDVKRHQLIGLVLAALFAGVAGALFVVVEGSVFPELLFWNLSLEIFIMCLFGGWFLFLGPLLGAAAVVGLRSFASIYTDYWTMILGILMMLLILFLPDGILGFFLRKVRGSDEPSAQGVG